MMNEIMATIGSVSGHLTEPSGAKPWPAVIVIHEWWGLDEQTKRIADRFAGIGYLAYAPDLFEGTRAQFGDNAKAMSLVQKHVSNAPGKLQSVYDALKTRSDCSGKIGCVGFCFGGKMALTLAINRPLDAICTFYGGGMQELFDQIEKIKCPVLGLYGDQDVSIPPGTIQQFKEILTRHGVEHEIKVYPNSGHAFFRDMDPTAYKPEAARDAWDRTMRFFARYLKSSPHNKETSL